MHQIVAHGMGAILTAIASAMGKSCFNAMTEANAELALAQAMMDARLDNPHVLRIVGFYCLFQCSQID